MLSPLVSIIIPIFNVEKYIFEALNSILSQSHTNLEIICIDDGSTDASLSIIYECKKRDDRIIILQNKTNVGIVASLNRGIDNARGDIIARMDGDDISLVNRIESQLKYLYDNNLEFIGSPVIYITEDGNEFGSSAYYEIEEVKKHLRYKSTLGHPTWMLYKKIYHKLNRYEDVAPVEDYDFLVRAVKKGVRVGMMKSPILKFRTQTNAGGTALINGLVQRKMFNYVKSIHEGNVRYDKKIVKKIRTPSFVVKKFFYISQITYTKAMRKKHQGCYSFFVFYLIFAMLLSPYQLQFIFRNIMVKLLSYKGR